MTPPYLLLQPRLPAGPVVLDSPHSGTHYPEDFGYQVELEQLRSAEDTHVDRLVALGPDLGIPLLAAQFPRTYVDVNRAADDIDPLLLAAPWPRPAAPSAKSRLGKGLVWRLLDNGTPIYRRHLSPAEVQDRIDRCWRPYHSALSQLLTQTAQRHGGVLHIDCHSMPSVAGLLATDEPGLQHPDIVLGDRDGTCADPHITTQIAQAFRRRGYSCWVNRPYKGVELVRAYACPAQERHAIQLEINRSLYMDETTLEPHPSGFAALQNDLHEVLSETQALMRGRLQRTDAPAV